MKKYFFTISLIVLILFNFSDAFGQVICPLNGQPLAPKGVKSFVNFCRLPVLEEGRIKPMDTFARNLLLRFSGKRRYQEEEAIAWLARLLFAPETTRADKIFLVNHEDIAAAIGLEPEKHRRYSFDQLVPGYAKIAELATSAGKMDAKARSEVEQEVIRVNANLKEYSELSRSFLFAFPHPDFSLSDRELREQLNLSSKSNEFSFFDIASRAELIYQLSQTLVNKKSEELSGPEQQLVQLMKNLYQWSLAYQNLPMTMIPSYSQSDSGWLSPWDAISRNFQIKECRAEIGDLQDLFFSYWNGEQLKFDLDARQFEESLKVRVSKKELRSFHKLGLEIAYNNSQLLLFAKMFYGIAFLLFLISLISDKKFLYQTSFFLLSTGAVCHVIAIALRVIILGRPPVSTLYETFLFVGAVSVALSLLIESRQRQWLGILVGSLSGFLFLTIATLFSADGDTMKMLVAVLNSNFWLSTHVLSITSGYAGCTLAGIVAHIYFLQRLARPKDTKGANSIYQILMGILGFGLTMTFLGTNLGGIWADQSWGRFWGWDPKENGALMIVLWTAMIFHARIGKMIGPLGVAALSVLGMIVVVWAWFGVNLLSVGLHSYGFTSGTLYWLIGYVILELFFLVWAVTLLKKE